MTKKERVLRAIEFRKPDRVPFTCVAPGISDIFYRQPMPAADWQPDEGFYPNIHPLIYAISGWKYEKKLPWNVQSPGFERQDEFGCIWKSAISGIGEVVRSPLKNLEEVDSLPIPDPRAKGRMERFIAYQKLLAGDSFVLGLLENGIWERSHFLRGYEQILMDIITDPEGVGKLLDRLMNEWYVPLINIFADTGAHGVMMTDDWGTQKSLMIRPATWRSLFKPRYARLIEAAHRRGLKFFLHSCGHIHSVIPDFIEIGLDVLQKDDIAFMGLEELAHACSGKICFMSSLDMQRTMPGASDAKIFEETRRMIRLFAVNNGGLIGTYYLQPEAAGATWRQMLLMHAAFIAYGRYPIK